MQNRDLLLIFARNPVPGKCKTRLAASIGNMAALNIYKFLLAHTQEITRSLNVKKQVWYSEVIWEHDIWDAALYGKKLQKGDHLGHRMEYAFESGFREGFRKIIVIGSDMFDLSQSDIELAFDELEGHDVVLGPAQDGGYYLLGMKRVHPGVFEDRPWGTSTVLESTLDDLEGIDVHLLAERNDVDVYDDIKDVPEFLPFLTANG